MTEGLEPSFTPCWGGISCQTHQYVVFVQSTSANRKLVGGSKFLYEVEDWERSADGRHAAAA